MTDYIGAAMAKPNDLLQYGRKGMKWGQRIFTAGDSGSPSKGKSAAPASTKKAASATSSSAKSAQAKTQGGSETSAQRYDRVMAGVRSGRVKEMDSEDLKFFNERSSESSAQRYSRIQADVRAGKILEMTSEDLKFFNARTEAIAKINKLNEQNPSWIRQTTTTVVQTAAQRQMQMVANALADKYVGDPVKEALNAKRNAN